MKTSMISVVVCAMAILMAGCSHQKLDWDNARIDGGKIYKQAEDTPFTGDVTNIPDTLIYGSAQYIKGQYLQVIWNNSHQSGACDGTVKDGYLNGEVTCTDNGVAYLVAHFVSGRAYGDYKWGKAGNLPGSHFLVEGSLDDQGLNDGTQTWYYSNDAKQLVMHYTHGKPDGDKQAYKDDGTAIAAQ